MRVQVRAMRLSDSQAVLDVARTLAGWFQPLDQMALAMDLALHEGLVAEQQGELVGFLMYHLLSPVRAELSWLGTLPTKQRHGVGSALLAALEARLVAMGITMLELSTIPADHDAAFAPTNRFYERHGFLPLRRDDAHYAHDRPRLLLHKTLF